ncbi:VacJ family lipoprotein [Rhodoferax sp. GW822-FHT02A01]|uniref:MlaA family lipoprotein n=1 Tax=Rhodoferax sp. GW822-FHT02A01 TaxID=3141537 RepID=UPI00315CD55F
MTRLAGCGRWLLVAALVALQGCATVAHPDPRDPMESFNRAMFGFNDKVDTVVLKPVAKGYRAVTPDWLRKGVGNFFNNLEDMWSVVNSALQGRGQEFSDNVGRVMINTTFGLLGVIDVASDLSIDRHTADFGQTLGRWGVPPGPYVVLPIMGPRTLREVAALPVDWQGEPLYNIGDQDTRTWLPVLDVVDLRAKYLNASDVLEGAALDSYTFRRDAYLQRQRNIQYDGNPPEEEDTAP